MQESELTKKERLAQLRANLSLNLQEQDHGFKLSSGIDRLDQALQGGFCYGSLCEWGMPPGQQGRQILLKILARNKPLCLWVYPGAEELIYPPAWQAHGVDLGRTYFIQNTNPVKELRPIFLERAFDLIVLDSPWRCTVDEQAFIKKQAKDLSTIIFILRPFLLKHERGNPFAKFRLNTSFNEKERKLNLDILRGSHPVTLQIKVEERGAESLC